MNVDVHLMAGNVTRGENGTMISVTVQCKKPIRHCLCEEDYAWNPSTCTCDCDKD